PNVRTAGGSMKVLVWGSRQWTYRDSIEKRLRMLPAGTTIISGAARGVDSIAASIGRTLGLGVREFPAEWNKFGRSAGYRRNLVMLEQDLDLVIAFHMGNSPGTGHAIEHARKKGIPTEVIRWKNC
ncbi:MAG: SLOG family protein, partial [Candidatus Binatia bacterium]